MRSICFVVVLAVAGGCHSEAGFPDARVYDAIPTPGTFSLSWTVTNTADGSPVTCDDADATTVSISVREVDSSGGQTEIFNCASMSGTSRPFPPGTYDLGFSLHGSGGDVATAPMASGIVIRSGADTPVGAVDFGLLASGAFTITVAAVPATTNCGPIGAMGGAIDTMKLTLTKAAACVPVVYTIGAGNYTAACPPAAHACIESNADIVSDAMASGRYQLQAVGFIGAAACWVGTREVRVPTAGANTTFSMGMSYQAAVPGCPPMP